MAFSRDTLDLVGRVMVKVVQDVLESKTYYPAGYYGQLKNQTGAPHNKRATGQLIDSVNYRIIDRGDIEVVEIYFKGARNETAAYFVDKGSRGPFRKAPPFSVISAWLQARHITAPGLTQEQLTYATMNSIKKKGIKGNKFITRSEDIMLNRVLPILEREAINDVEEIFDQIIYNFNQEQ